MADAQPWTFRLPMPPAGWLELDLTATVAPGAGEQAEILARCARDAKRRGAIVAFVRWRPDSEPAPRAVLNVTAIPRPESSDDLGALGSALGGEQEADRSPRVVEIVDLPVGRALRVRVYAAGGRNPGGGEAVIDVVQYWLPVAGTTQLLVASSSTTEIANGDDVAGLLDALMDGLTLQVPTTPLLS